ncbi:hypothetical protein EV182_002296 [Spiromyces aspiralis]|uniref:Uncharacterized protein n=1 Tax=Spiromyces aspiralis TaxID=68401 RepID=A0ACC1HVG9_9FUNG|nr:hypothetical protein EV182_002296 [Spiromyces aspiralis]
MHNNNNNNNGGVPSLRPHTTYDTILDDDVTMDPGESNKFSQSYDVLCLAEVRGRSNSGTADAGTAATTLPQDTMAADTTADDVSDLPHGAPPAPCGNAAPADDDNSDDCSESPSDEEAGTHEPAPRQPPSSSSSMPLPTIPEDDGYRISIDTEVIDIWNYYAN